jgi:integrase/recombinase XerC
MPSIHEALAAYERQARANGRSPHSINQARRHVRALAFWLAAEGRQLDVERLDPGAVAEFMGSPAATHRADGRWKLATSTNALRSSLRTFLAYVHDAGLAPENAARLLRPAVCGAPPPRALTEDQERRLVAALDAGESQRDRLAFLLMLRAGLRLGSVVALDAEDGDLAEGVLDVRLKRDRRERVPVPRAVRDELEAFLAGRTSGPVFASQSGRRQTARQLQRRFAQVVERAGLPRGTSCHTLRHSFATRLLRTSGNLELVRRAMCHRAASTTSIYLRVEDAELREAIGA